MVNLGMVYHQFEPDNQDGPAFDWELTDAHSLARQTEKVGEGKQTSIEMSEKKRKKERS